VSSFLSMFLLLYSKATQSFCFKKRANQARNIYSSCQWHNKTTLLALAAKYLRLLKACLEAAIMQGPQSSEPKNYYQVGLKLTCCFSPLRNGLFRNMGRKDYTKFMDKL
jgi:hypothetical protein